MHPLRVSTQSVCVVVAAVLAASVLTGVASTDAAYEGAPVSNGASIVGTVKFRGTAPAPQRFNVKMGSNPEFCNTRANEKGEVLLPSTKLGAGNELAEVVIFLQEVDKGKPTATDGPTVNIDRCQFGPRVVTGMLGQTLRIGTQDKILHQVRGWESMGKNRMPMFMAPGLTAGGEQAVPLQIKRSSIVQLTCDQHRFMEAWVLVTSNPYATVTDADGTFRLTDIPPGTHTLGAWHPVLGYQEAKLTLTAGHETSVTLTMTPEPPPAKK